MAGEHIEVEGLKELQRALRRAKDEDLKKALKSSNKAAAQDVADEAQNIVPVKSGKLLESIKAGVELKSGYVKAGSGRVEYAGPIHFGWRSRNIEPNPFLYDALDNRREAIFAEYERDIDKITDRLNRSGV